MIPSVLICGHMYICFETVILFKVHRFNSKGQQQQQSMPFMPFPTNVDAIYAISNNSRYHLCHFQQQSMPFPTQSMPFMLFPTTVMPFMPFPTTVNAIYAISNNSRCHLCHFQHSRCHLCHFQQQLCHLCRFQQQLMPFPTTVDAIYAISNISRCHFYYLHSKKNVNGADWS